MLKILNHKLSFTMAVTSCTTFLAMSLLMSLSTLKLSIAGEVIDRVVAVVNSGIVTSSELEQGLREASAQGHSVSKEEMLDALIEERLIDSEAERIAIPVRDDEVTTAIKNRQKAIGVSDEDFKKLLEREGLSMTVFRSNIEQGLRRARLVDLMVKTNISISDEEIATFYTQNADKFQEADTARLAEFFLKAPSALPIEKRAKIKTRIMAYRRQILDGANFVDIAHEHSEGSTAKYGGDLGYLNIRQMKPAFRAAALSLSLGEVSRVIETERGFHLLTVTETRSGERIPFGKVRQRIHTVLFQEKTAQRYEQWVSELKANARIDIRL